MGFMDIVSPFIGPVVGSLLGNSSPSGFQGPPNQSQTQNFNTGGGLFSSNYQDFNLTQNLDPAMQQLQQQALAQAQQFGGQGANNATADIAGQQGQNFLGGLQQDPFAAQQQLFNQQNQLLLPQQADARQAQEARLFAQGRLGSSGSLSGQAQQEALLNSQAQQTQGLFNQSFGQAQAQQAQQAGIGQQLSQLDPNIRGLFGNLQQQQFGNLFGINQQANASAQLAGQLASTSGQPGAFDVNKDVPSLGGGGLFPGLPGGGAGGNQEGPNTGGGGGQVAPVSGPGQYPGYNIISQTFDNQHLAPVSSGGPAPQTGVGSYPGYDILSQTFDIDKNTVYGPAPGEPGYAGPGPGQPGYTGGNIFGGGYGGDGNGSNTQHGGDAGGTAGFGGAGGDPGHNPGGGGY